MTGRGLGGMAPWRPRPGTATTDRETLPSMKKTDPSDPLGAASRRHLNANATECAHRNIIIRVDALNADRTVAFCSVEQREHGLLRRTYSRSELVWRAEQALAPMIGSGILPMINVHMASDPGVADTRRDRHSPFAWLRWVRGWLGYPGIQGRRREDPGAEDPFGLHRALQLTR